MGKLRGNMEKAMVSEFLWCAAADITALGCGVVDVDV
jgi:hypothetical protein